MRVYTGSKELKFPESAVALGDFDAIHKGHIKIINSAGKFAKENKLLWVVYMFSDRPNKYAENINTLGKRLEILEQMGVDAVVVEEFTEEYKNTSCEDFVREYLSKRLNSKAVFAGYNYRFGKDAKGNTETLKALCKAQGIDVLTEECVKVNDIPVSSTEIRELIRNGEVGKAKELMTRYFSLSGEVVKGKQLGRTIGFPTANIDYPDGIIIPMHGVYITRSKIGENKYYSITNVGKKPTVGDKNENIETAIGEFSEDIYGKEIRIEFCRKIREITKFDDLNALKSRLDKDMKASKEFFDKEKENEQLG